jgi:hypothetical protein
MMLSNLSSCLLETLKLSFSNFGPGLAVVYQTVVSLIGRFSECLLSNLSICFFFSFTSTFSSVPSVGCLSLCSTKMIVQDNIFVQFLLLGCLDFFHFVDVFNLFNDHQVIFISLVIMKSEFKKQQIYYHVQDIAI